MEIMVLYGYCWNVGDNEYISMERIVDILAKKNGAKGNEERNAFVCVCVCVCVCACIHVCDEV